MWRGEHFAASRSEYLQVKAQLAAETFPPAPAQQYGGRYGVQEEQGPPAMRSWGELSPDEQHKALQDRLKKYCQKVGR